MNPSSLRIEPRAGIVFATIAGELDMSNVQLLRTELGHAIGNQPLALVLDLSGVSYLDSAGIHLIHSLRSDLRSHGQRLVLIIPPESVINDALRLAGLTWEDSRVHTEPEAMELLGLGATGPGLAEVQPAVGEVQPTVGETQPAT